MFMRFSLQYIILFSILVILETIVAISAYIMTNQVDNMVGVRMNYAFSQFNYDPTVRASIHLMQRTVIKLSTRVLTRTIINAFNFQLECCGIHNYAEWFEVSPDGKIPYSCFASQDSISAPFPLGCFKQMSQAIGYVINLIASGTTVIIIFQIICIVSAVIFIIQLKNYRKLLVLQNSPNIGGVTMHTLPPMIEEKVRF